jgi:hypothetical protein
MPARKTSKKSKKKATNKTAARKLTTSQAAQLVKIEQLGKAVGTAVSRALARQDLSGIRGPILCGIIYRPNTGTFSPLFKTQF